MKKINFLAAALLCGGVAFAQSNSSQTTQNGNGNSADVDQTGSSNSSIINQTQSFNGGHTADVTQEGTSNLSDLLQDQSSAQATVIQKGGADNEVRLKQSGNNEASDIYQEGSRNIVGSYSNIANRAFQKNGTGSFPNDKNTLDIEQIGEDNKIGLWQEHHATASLIKQEGDFNEAYIYQSGAPQNAIQSVSLTQTGDDHYADMNFYGEGNDFSLTQTGNANVGDNGLGNEVDLDVTGDGNMGTLSQDGTENYGDIDVTGSNNLTVDLMQDGTGNDAFMSITGDDNSMSVSQTGSNHTATETIMGNNNSITVTQND